MNLLLLSEGQNSWPSHQHTSLLGWGCRKMDHEEREIERWREEEREREGEREDKLERETESWVNKTQRMDGMKWIKSKRKKWPKAEEKDIFALRTVQAFVDVRSIKGNVNFFFSHPTSNQFHQHFTLSFYACRSQKRKKTLNSSCLLCFWDLRA